MLMDFAKDYEKKNLICYGFKGLKDYAIKKLKYAQLIKNQNYKYELAKKRRIFNQIISYTLFSKEWIRNLRNEYQRLQNM
jgi:hypothetical protein